MEAVQIPYGFGTTTPLPYDDALQRVTELLREEGFGILTQIDVQKTLREKLGAGFRRYAILGACNPPLAHQAFLAEPNVGLLLPCNVIVYEQGSGSVVAFLDPAPMMETTGNPALEPVAREVRERLLRVKERLAG
jgi:uncharacterized protein (DUF302 family)